MNLIKPKKLKEGDTIAIIAPSGNIDIEKINNAKKYFENRGYKIKSGSHLECECRYLGGKDEDRLSDIHEAFADNNINAIICARGGYGAVRLIKKINYNLIKNNPKIFCGYSDITALSAMILKNTGLITFSGPMAQSDFANTEINYFTESEFFKTLSNKSIKIEPDNPIAYRNGNTDGILFGGNLATIVSLCGQDFIPDEKFIFFAEDLNEEVYKIDKYFTQLLNMEKFKTNLSGIILGDFLNIDNLEYFNELFYELASRLNVPVISGYPISHSKTKATIPYGAAARLHDNVLTIENFTDE